MDNIFERQRPTDGTSLPLLSAGLALCACASLDPADDLGRAQQLVASRSDVPTDWSGPWSPDAVQWQPEQALGADDAARLALHNHAGLRVSVESIVTARADYVQAHLLPNPTITLLFGFPLNGAVTYPGMALLMQPLNALWEQPTRVDAADARLRATVLSVSDAALRLVAEARSAQARLVFAERDLELETDSLDLAREGLELVDQRLAQGEAPQLLRNGMALELLDAETRTRDARVRRDRARRALLEVCGVAAAAEMPRTDGQSTAIPEWFGHLTERDLIEMAERQRLDVAASHALATGAVDEADLAELRRIPDISLGVNYRRNFEGQEAVGPGLALEIPIFDDGRANAAGAHSLARAAAAEAERIRQGAIAEVRDAYVQLRGALENLEHLRGAILELAVTNHALAEESLAAGVIDRGTVIELARRELRVRLDANALELSAVLSFIELERSAGGRIADPAQTTGDGTPAAAEEGI